MRVNSVNGQATIRTGLRYEGKPGPLLRAIRKCAMKGLEIGKAQDLANIQEELDRATTWQGGGEAA